MTTRTATMADAFGQAYADRRWHNGSGSGSEPDNTLAWRCFLDGLIRTRGFGSVLDIGCGDLKVMASLEWDRTEYNGIDVVPAIIERNRQHHRAMGHFICGDALEIDWPQTDLIVVKDLLAHWPDDAVERLRARLMETSAVVLVVTDIAVYRGDELADSAHSHRDIEPGQYRPLDPRLAPHRWPIEEIFRYFSVSLPQLQPRTDVKAVLGW